jgi:hypothetical protein
MHSAQRRLELLIRRKLLHGFVSEVLAALRSTEPEDERPPPPGSDLDTDPPGFLDTLWHRRLQSLARQSMAYVEFEKQFGRPPTLVEFERFARAGPDLDRAAERLGLTRDQMWQRSEAAVAEAKQTDEGWRVYRDTSWDRVPDLSRIAEERRRFKARYPNSGRRWREKDERDLVDAFREFRAEGLNAPRGFLRTSALLERLSRRFGRTPDAIYSRLYRLGLID